MPEVQEPRLTEIATTFSAGGKVKIVKYDVDSSYFVSESRKYEIPDSWTEEEADAFLELKYQEIRERVDKRADDEFNERWDQSYLSKL